MSRQTRKAFLKDIVSGSSRVEQARNALLTAKDGHQALFILYQHRGKFHPHEILQAANKIKGPLSDILKKAAERSRELTKELQEILANFNAKNITKPEEGTTL